MDEGLQTRIVDPARDGAAVTVRALLVGERLDVRKFEPRQVIATYPTTLPIGDGYAVLFRYGVVVMIGLSPIEEDEVVRGIGARITGAYKNIEDETATIEVAPERDDQVVTGSSISLKDLSPPRVLVIADVLAKNVALVRDEREVNKVLELIEPFASRLATTGRGPYNRRHMLRLIGQALLVQHRISGRIAVAEKPDVLWDRSDLERLYARLEDEYELKERANALQHKLQVIEGTSRALIDIIDTERSSRLEATIVLLIVVEVLIAFYDLFFRIAK